MAKDRFGLRELPQDKRDFQLGAFFALPDLNDLPDSFEFTTQFSIKHQGDTDFCSAYSSCGVSELQEKVVLHPEYSFAASKRISGNVDAWGQNLRDACKAHIKHGALPEKELSELDKAWDASTSRHFSHYEKYRGKALPQRKKSYMQVTGPYDPYDNIRATIWKFKEEKRAIMIGIVFSWPLEQYILNTVQESGFGHALYITGWDDDGLVAVNSYGESTGKNGKHRITREVINSFAPRYGMYMFVDIDAEEAKKTMERFTWTTSSWYEKVCIKIQNWWKEVWK